MKLFRPCILSSLLSIMLLNSCAAVEEPQTGSPTDSADPTAGAGRCTLTVTISAGNVQSRAGDSTWGDPYPAEEAIANESSINSLDLFFVTPSGEPVAMAPQLISSAGGQYVYKFSVSLDADFVGTNSNGVKTLTGRIVAMANYPGGTQANPFTAAPFSIDEIVNNNGSIPMWGVASIGPVRLIDGQSVDAGNISLLRSVPKISVDLADDIADEFKITGITPMAADYNTMAYCQPSGAATAVSTLALPIEGCFNATSRSTGTLTAIYGLNSASARLYTADRELAGNGSTPQYLNVTIARRDGSGAPFSGRVYLCDYVEGTPDFSTAFSRLVRNHDYRYVISLSELEFKISFRRWVFGGKVHVELE